MKLDQAKDRLVKLI